MQVILGARPNGQLVRQPTARGTISQGSLNILRNGRVPGGVVTVSGCGGGASFPPLVMGATTVGAALSAWLRNDRAYVVRVSQGVTTIVPRAGLPGLLRVRIGHFSYNGRRDRALAALERLPRVLRAQSALRLVQVTDGGLYSAYVPPSIQVHLRSSTYFEALNAIARAEGAGVWYFHEERCTGRGSGFSVGFASEGPTGKVSRKR